MRTIPHCFWAASKVFAEGEFEVVGVEPTTTRAPSALLAARDSAGRLQYVGQAMVTLSAENRNTFWAYVEQTPRGAHRWA
jgi:hypothetical protein